MLADADAQVRAAVFEFLRAQSALRGGPVLTRDLLIQGIMVAGVRVPLLGPSGIFKPAVCELPLSITTVPVPRGGERPYDDEYGYDGIHYRYRGSDPKHRDNVGLREAMRRHVPLVYFHGHRPGLYHAEWPVYVVGDDPGSLTFTVVTDEPSTTGDVGVAEPLTRAYLARVMLQRIHQSAFRELVLSAYGDSCAVCRLRHRELLEAAHILPDGDPRGAPVVPNGLALCKLHHAAFDSYIIGVRPGDLLIQVRRDILEEIDGPMLKHGLQGIDQQRLVVPQRADERPKEEFLAERYERFLKAS